MHRSQRVTPWLYLRLFQPDRWLRLLGLLLSTILIVVGCQQSSLQLSPDSSVVLELSGWGSSHTEQALLRQVLRDFEAQHPQIKVKFEMIADQYMDVMKTRLVGDAAPDVFYLDAVEAPLLMKSGVLEPLDAYITPEFDLSDFEENLLQPFQYQNQIYGLPKDFSTLALFYNRQAFASANLNAPPYTWDELQAYSQQLTLDRNQDGRTDQYGMSLIPELARQAYVIKSFGGQVVDAQDYARFAEQPGLQGLEMLVAQYRDDRTSARPQDVGTNSGIEMFGQGKAAMVIEGNWAIPYFADTFPALDYATAEVPVMNNQPGTMAYTVAYVMNHQSQHKAEAWELIAYLTGKEGMEKWTSTGFALPTRRSVAQKLRYDQDPLRSPLVAGARYAMPWQIGTYPTAVINSFNNQFISALLGEQPLEPAIQLAQENANQQILAAQ
ncbi:MAG: ABC transporter substrate-binding protein [Elainellaceae cyanobacterium]